MKFALKLLATTALSFVAIAQIATAATYHVPTPQALKHVSTFQIAEPRFGQKVLRNQVVRYIRYQLPAELVGSKVVAVEMEIQNITSHGFQLVGPAGSATCERRQPIHCNIRYKNLQIDSESVAKLLKRQAKSEFEFNQRLQVAEIFRNDPVGVLEYIGEYK